MRFWGMLLIIVGILILAFIFLPIGIQELQYNLPHDIPEKIAETPKQISQLKAADPEFSKTTMVPVNFEFSLLIPQIGVNSNVSPNVDSGNPDEYLSVLQTGVAHALGSSLPNEPGPVFIFAHSTDSFWNIRNYNAVFFLLNKLNGGEDVYVFHENFKYQYQVTEKRIVEPEDISYIVSTTTDNVLILQTCYPPGTTSKRLLVFAKLLE